MSRAQLTSTDQQNSGGPVSPFMAGKNKVINGDFGVWQRGTSFSNPKGVYLADRYNYNYDGTGNITISQQSFTPGAAPVAGYESQYFLRINQTTAGSGNNFSVLAQPIENVQTLAGQTVTVSFWAKADTSRALSIQLRQDFGSGGSSNVDTSGAGATLTTSWARYTNTITLPSISGKTIGTGSALRIFIYVPGNTTQTIDLWGIQVEAGSVATPFTTASGTVQGELALCQRYYQNINGEDMWGAYSQSTQVAWWYKNAVTMRTNPTPTYPSSFTNIIDKAGVGYASATSIVTGNTSPTVCLILANGAGSASVGQPAGYAGSTIQLSAEL